MLMSVALLVFEHSISNVTVLVLDYRYAVVFPSLLKTLRSFACKQVTTDTLVAPLMRMSRALHQEIWRLTYFNCDMRCSPQK